MASSNASAGKRARRCRLACRFALAIGLAASAHASGAAAGEPAAADAAAIDAAPALPSSGAVADQAPADTGGISTEGAPAAALASGPAGLSALLAGMRSTTGVVAEFTETRELALLSSPLEATGTIWFVPPDRLVRLVSSPGRSRLVVDGDKVRFESDTGVQALDLSASPIARQMVDSFVVLFNGDEARLRELYDATFEAGIDGDPAKWHLRLTPRSAPLNRMVSSFDMQGSDRRIDRMESVEPDGDRTVTRFGRTEISHVFGRDELEQLFAAQPAR